jgi:hypothetical protein
MRNDTAEGICRQLGEYSKGAVELGEILRNKVNAALGYDLNVRFTERLSAELGVPVANLPQNLSTSEWVHDKMAEDVGVEASTEETRLRLLRVMSDRFEEDICHLQFDVAPLIEFVDGCVAGMVKMARDFKELNFVPGFSPLYITHATLLTPTEIYARCEGFQVSVLVYSAMYLHLEKGPYSR